MAEGARVAEDGMPAGLLRPSGLCWVWWRAEAKGADLVAVDHGRVLKFPTATAAWQTADQRGWPYSNRSDKDTQPIDLQPVYAWLSRKRLDLEADSALNLWNFADDVARSIGLRNQRAGSTADRLHAILTAASVPWAFPARPSQWHWTPRDLVRLRVLLQCARRTVDVYIPG